MKLEFIKTDQNIPFDCCPCTGHDFFEDSKRRNVITVDGIPFSTYAKEDAEEACQFPYTYKEFAGGNYNHGHLHHHCSKIPYRIIKMKRS
jgi:hypothetical protein